MRRLLLTLGLLSLAAGPQRAAGEASPGRLEAPAPAACLAGTSGSLTELADRFLEALARSNAESLRAMALSREEFERVVWPDLPASRIGVSADWVWGMYEPKNATAFQRLLRLHGGIAYGLREIRFTGESSDYGSYRVHRGSLLIVEDPRGGEKTLRLFGAVLEQSGRFKVYGFVTD